MMRMMILRPKRPSPWWPCGRTKSTSKVRYLPLTANSLVVPDPGTVLKWPECMGMFPRTHCTECARKDHLATGTKYIFNAAICGCGATRCHSLKICSACVKENIAMKDCSTEGCGEKRASRMNGISLCKACIARKSINTIWIQDARSQS